MSVPTATYYPGETIRVWATDLTHLDDGAITENATVTFAIVDRSGNELTGLGEGEGVPENDDWHIDLTMPEQPGQYRIQATAVYEGDVWKGLANITIRKHH